jgi:hypothetical protein
MKDLTYKLFEDYKPFIEESYWEQFKKNRLEENSMLGPIVHIHNIYSVDGDIIERVYQREYEIGTEYGFALNCASAGVKNFNELSPTA